MAWLGVTAPPPPSPVTISGFASLGATTWHQLASPSHHLTLIDFKSCQISLGDTRLSFPPSIYLCGCWTPQSGKNEFVKRFIQHVEDMVTPIPIKIIWSYGELKPSYQSLMDKVDFVQGLPNLPLYSQEPLLLVIDDQMRSMDQCISSLFTKGSHHRNLS